MQSSANCISFSSQKMIDKCHYIFFTEFSNPEATRLVLALHNSANALDIGVHATQKEFPVVLNVIRVACKLRQRNSPAL
jgi:hypothetical protein